MSERRRMLTEKKGRFVEDGLLFWFDGKNNLQGGGYSTSATKWYAYMSKNNILSSVPLNKEGSPVWQAKGGFTTNGNAKQGYGSGSIKPHLLTKFGTISDFTIICCFQQINNMSSDRILFNAGWRVFQIAIDPTAHVFFIDGSDSGWNAHKESNVINLNTAKFAALTRNGNTFTFYVNGEPCGSVTYSSFNNFRSTDTSSAQNFELGTYEYGNSIDEFYGSVMYNRCITSSEIKDMFYFLKSRYEL